VRGSRRRGPGDAGIGPWRLPWATPGVVEGPGQRVAAAKGVPARSPTLTEAPCPPDPVPAAFQDRQKTSVGLTIVSVPPLPNIRVVRSRIHGYGVIAKRDIEVNEVIAEVEGIHYRRDELGDDTYCLWVHDDCYLDMVDQTRWINHSCDPNAEVEADDDGSGPWARIVALRRIPAGEEITYHYAFAHELAEPCTCGASICEGWIVDPEEKSTLAERLAREKAEAAARTVGPVPIDARGTK
jgi:uncharacterized protein